LVQENPEEAEGGGMRRTALQRLDEIPGVFARRSSFCDRVEATTGDIGKLAELMAEAIENAAVARGLEVVGRDGRKTVCFEEIAWAQAMNQAASAYRSASAGKPQHEN
jgi:hypothetical protein